MHCFTGIRSEKCVFWQFFVRVNIMERTHTNLDVAAYYCKCMSCKAAVPNLFGAMDWYCGRGGLPGSMAQVSFIQCTMDWGCRKRQSSPELHSPAVDGRWGNGPEKLTCGWAGDGGGRRSSGKLCLQPCDVT